MSARRALFLDRDGVINVDHGYVGRIDEVRFVDGIFELCRAATQRRMLLIVVTNQAGIGRGYFGEQDFDALMRWMRERFAREQAPIDDVFHCPFHPVHGIGAYRRDSFDRKPNPGMLLRARERHGLELAASVMVGDKPSDMEAAWRAGVGVRCLYDPDGTQADEPRHTHRVATLRDAVALLDPAR